MKTQFFGQPIASKIILSSLKGNSNRSKNNKKPLVMSFHGWAGSGKNFISDLIASHLFKTKKIQNLRYHVTNGRADFPIKSKLNDYKVNIFFNYISKGNRHKIVFLRQL